MRRVDAGGCAPPVLVDGPESQPPAASEAAAAQSGHFCPAWHGEWIAHEGLEMALCECADVEDQSMQYDVAYVVNRDEYQKLERWARSRGIVLLKPGEQATGRRYSRVHLSPRYDRDDPIRTRDWLADRIQPALRVDGLIFYGAEPEDVR